MHYRVIEIDDIKIFYREAGSSSAPTLVLLHGFPTSSYMFRNLMRMLASDFHVVAPDLPGFGLSEMPLPQTYAYSYDQLAKTVHRFLDTLGLWRFSLYMHDLGAPVGLRIATRQPNRIESLIFQNANISMQGYTSINDSLFEYWRMRNPKTELQMRKMFTPELVKWRHTAGMSNPEELEPEFWTLSQAQMARPGAERVQLDLLYDARRNLELHGVWQSYFAEHQPPLLVLWGENDPIYSREAALAYKQMLPSARLQFLASGHFALEEECGAMAGLVLRFLNKKVVTAQHGT